MKPDQTTSIGRSLLLASNPVRNVIRLLANALASAILIAGCGVFGPEPPESLKRASTDSQWAQTELDKIIHKRKTTGTLFTPNNKSRELGSGEGDKESDFADYVIRTVAGADRQKYRYLAAAASHVETKAAAAMTLGGIDYAVQVINNQTCAACRKAMPVVLRQGYRLLVWEPDEQGQVKGPETVDGEGEIR